MGPHRAGIPGQLVPVGSNCASQRRAVSRGPVHPWSERWAEVGSEPRSSSARPSGQRGGPESEARPSSRRHGPELEARPSGRRLDRPSGLSLGIWAGPGVARCSQRRLPGRAFTGKQIHEGPRVYKPDTMTGCINLSSLSNCNDGYLTSNLCKTWQVQIVISSIQNPKKGGQ